MRTGRPKRPLTLTEDEQERLQSLAHRARSQPALARRARVVLACAQGLANQSVAKKLRFGGLQVIPRKFQDSQVVEIFGSHGIHCLCLEKRASRLIQVPSVCKLQAPCVG